MSAHCLNICFPNTKQNALTLTTTLIPVLLHLKQNEKTFPRQNIDV